MLNPGHILDGKYEIIRTLGQGGMGTVYLCRNTRLGNLWAVKEVNKEWNSKLDFLAEPNILKDLQHNGIVRIVDIFHERENLYIVEDYIEGKTLKEHVSSSGPLPSEQAADIALQISSILDYLHNLTPPIIYRDLKPSNIMITPSNKVVLIDFGIARTYKEGQDGDTIILGSKGYIAPEQLVNVQSNAQTDIYSLGAVMYFMLTGKSISLPTELMFDENYPEAAPKNMISIIRKASAIEPLERFVSVKELVSELESVISEMQYKKTVFIKANNEVKKTSHDPSAAFKKPGKKIKLILIAVLALIIALIIYMTLQLSGKNSVKKPSPSVVPNTAEKSTPKPEAQPPKEVIDKDVIVKGVLDSKNPIVLSYGNSSGKAKGKDKEEAKNINVQFNLNPSASVSNSKLSIALTQVQILNKDVVAVLNIQNLADENLKLDLSKTYLVNGNNKAVRSYNPNSSSLLAIPQSQGKQEVKLYFKDFSFEGNTFTLKTVLSSNSTKDINLYTDIK